MYKHTELFTVLFTCTTNIVRTCKRGKQASSDSNYKEDGWLQSGLRNYFHYTCTIIHTHTHTVGHLHHKEAIPIIPTDEGFHCRQGKVEHSGCVHKEKGRKESHSQWQRSITLLGCSNQLQIHNYNLLLLLLCPLNLRCDVCCRAFDTLDRKLNKKKNRN